MAEDRLVRGLQPAGGNHDLHARCRARAEQRHRAEIDMVTGVHGAGRREPAIAQSQHLPVGDERHHARGPVPAAQRHALEHAADASLVRAGRGVPVRHHAQHRRGCPLTDQLGQEARRVRAAATARIVLRVGKHDRAVAADSIACRTASSADQSRPWNLGSAAAERRGKPVGRCLDGGGVVTVDDDRGPQTGVSAAGKPVQIEAEASQPVQHRVERAGGLDRGALPGQGDQEVDPAEGLGQSDGLPAALRATAGSGRR